MNFLQNVLPIPSEYYEGTYLVGGAIRDHFLGFTPSDFDIVSNKNTKKLASRISKETGGRVISIGSSPNTIFKVLSKKITIDIVSLKGKNIVEDVLKRDFTINAIAYDLSSGKLFDPTEGMQDIKKKRIKTITSSVFRKDPIRLLRAYRFSLSLSFTIAKSTQKEIVKNGSFIEDVPGERIWLELNKIFNHPRSWTAIADMEKSGIIFKVFPELLRLQKRNYDDHGCIDLQVIKSYKYIESVLASKDSNTKPILYDACKNIIGVKKYSVLKYGLLLNQITKEVNNIHKISTKMVGRNNRRRVKIIYSINKRLKLSLKKQKFVQSLIKASFYPTVLFEAQQKGHLTKRWLFGYFEKYGPVSIAAILGSLAEIMAKAQKIDSLNLKVVDIVYFLIEQYMGPYYNAKIQKPLITGRDLIKIFNMSPSPKFKIILTEVHRSKIFGEIPNREKALKIIKQFLE